MRGMQCSYKSAASCSETTVLVALTHMAWPPLHHPSVTRSSCHTSHSRICSGCSWRERHSVHRHPQQQHGSVVRARHRTTFSSDHMPVTAQKETSGCQRPARAYPQAPRCNQLRQTMLPDPATAAGLCAACQAAYHLSYTTDTHDNSTVLPS